MIIQYIAERIALSVAVPLKTKLVSERAVRENINMVSHAPLNLAAATVSLRNTVNV